MELKKVAKETGTTSWALYTWRTPGFSIAPGSRLCGKGLSRYLSPLKTRLVYGKVRTGDLHLHVNPIFLGKKDPLRPLTYDNRKDQGRRREQKKDENWITSSEKRSYQSTLFYYKKELFS